MTFHVDFLPHVQEVQGPKAGEEAIEANAASNGATQTGTGLSPHAPMTLVAGGMRPVRVALEGRRES